jgi:hypothetical protein
VIRIVAPEGNYDYQNKYFTDDTQYLVPCGLPAGEESRDPGAGAQGLPRAGLPRLGAGRRDDRRATRKPYLLEINTSPGMTGHSLVPMSAKAAGISYEDLCLQLLPRRRWTRERLSHEPAMNAPTPMDVRLMNMTAAALFAGCSASSCAGATELPGWRHAGVRDRGIVVTGDVVHNNAVTLRANVAPRLAGTFFTLDLARRARPSRPCPGCASAVVRREFPNRCRCLAGAPGRGYTGVPRATRGWSTILAKCSRPTWAKWSRTVAASEWPGGPGA